MIEELTTWDALALFSKIVAYVGCFLSAGSTLYLLASPGIPSRIKYCLQNIIVVSAVIGAVGSLGQIAIQSGRLLDEGVSGMLDEDMLSLILEGPLGTSVLLRIGGLIAIVVAAFSVPLAWAIGALGATLTISAFSFVGHGTTEPRLLMATLVSIHLLGISFWIGALWPLRKMASDSTDTGRLGKLTHRFGHQAAWVVGILIIAGSILAYQIIGSLWVLISSQYGLTLLTKLFVITGLLLLAASNKLRFVPAIQNGSQKAKTHLRKSISLEMVFVTFVLIITAVLTTVTSLPKMSHE